MKKVLNKFEDGPFTPMKTPTIEEWEKEFDNEFPQELVRKSINWGLEDDPKDDIKQFIATQIKQAKKEERELMVKEIEKQNVFFAEELGDFPVIYKDELLESIKRT
jgi:hypothetical protein